MNDFEGLRPNFSNLILTNEHTQMYEGKLIIGQAGISTKSQETQTGFYRKKYFDYKASSVGWWTSEHHYIEFRLAEIMLNRAEAAFELGIKIEQAKADIKAIRDRAGAVEIPDAVIDLSVVREERRRELAFEIICFGIFVGGEPHIWNWIKQRYTAYILIIFLMRTNLFFETTLSWTKRILFPNQSIL